MERFSSLGDWRAIEATDKTPRGPPLAGALYLALKISFRAVPANRQVHGLPLIAPEERETERERELAFRQDGRNAWRAYRARSIPRKKREPVLHLFVVLFSLLLRSRPRVVSETFQSCKSSLSLSLFSLYANMVH